MKHTKRIFCLALALLMAIGVAACGGDVPPSDGVAGTEGTEIGTETAPPCGGCWPTLDRPAEMVGKTYVLLQEEVPENPFGFGQETEVGQLLAAHIAEVETLYGCKLEFLQVPQNDHSQSQMSIFDLGGTGDIFFGSSTLLRRSLRSAPGELMFENMLKYDQIINFWDFNKWGNIYARECLMEEGEFYGVTPALWRDCTPLPLYAVVYNRDMISACGGENPGEYWEKEEWDTHAMEEVLKKTTIDGKWGMTASMDDMVHGTVLACGESLIELRSVNADGSLVWENNLDSDEVISSLQWLKNTLSLNKNCFNNGQNDWALRRSHEPFAAGQSAMALTSPAQILEMAGDLNFDFGVITWPSKDFNYVAGGYGEVTAIAIPTFAQNTTHSAHLIHDLFKGFGEVKDYRELLQYYRDTYFKSDVDLDCLMQTEGSTGYTYWVEGVCAPFYNISQNLMASTSVKTLVETSAERGDSAIENRVLANLHSLQKWREVGKID